jgi:hypothetical protein
MFLVLYVLGPIFSILVLFFIRIEPNPFLVPILCIPFGMVLSLGSLYLSYNRSRDILCGIKYAINPERLESKTNNGGVESNYQWAALPKISKRNGFIVVSVRLRPPYASCIPERIFKAKLDAGQFYECMAQYWEQAHQSK